MKEDLIPEIEDNCVKYGIAYPNAYQKFQEYKFAPNSIYFHHGYAEKDILVGQEYTAAAYCRNGAIQSDSIQKCNAKVLCFFTAFHTRPSDLAMQGHHELDLIQFEKSPLPIFNKLFEITESKPLPLLEYCIYLGEESELRELARRQAEDRMKEFYTRK